MQWNFVRDNVGVFDHTKFEMATTDYWINGAGSRISYYGRGKGITNFTYRHGAIWFRFEFSRKNEELFNIDDDGYAGNICTVYIKDDRLTLQGGSEDEKAFKEISEFLMIYRAPGHDEEPLIERVIINKPQRN